MTASRQWTMSWCITSDRRSQSGFGLSIRYSERLAEAGFEPSVGSNGDKYDNALAETINGLTTPRSFIGADVDRPNRR